MNESENRRTAGNAETENCCNKLSAGAITEETGLAHRFYGDVWIGAAGCCCHVAQDHEVNLCAFYNRRVPGGYRFIPEYQFFVTKENVCQDLFWNLGNLSDSSLILEQYAGVGAAEASPYGPIFLELKDKIESTINMLKEEPLDPYLFAGSLFSYTPDSEQEKQLALTYTMCECPIRDRQEFVQFYVSGDRLKKLSISQIPLEDMMRFFPDFETLDREVLHLRTFLPVRESALQEGSLYHEVWLDALDSIEFDRQVMFE